MTEATNDSTGRDRSATFTAGIAIAGIAVVIILIVGGVRYATQFRAGMLATQGYEALARGDIEEGLRLTRASLRLDDRDPTTWYNLGVAHLELNQFDEAIVAFRQARERDPNDTELQRALSEAKGYRALLEGDYKESVERYREALWLGDNNVNLWHAFGVALLRIGEFDEAIEAHQAALQIDPENPDLIEALGDAYSEAGYEAYLSEDYERSARLYRKATEQLGENAEAWFNLCTALYALRKYDDALQAVRRASQLQPENPTYTYMVRRIVRERDEALSAADDAPDT